MNPKLMESIHTFVHLVEWYIQQEYDTIYGEKFIEYDLFDFIASYYMGGNTVPDTTRYVIELILMKEREKKNEKSL